MAGELFTATEIEGAVKALHYGVLNAEQIVAEIRRARGTTAPPVLDRDRLIRALRVVTTESTYRVSDGRGGGGFTGSSLYLPSGKYTSAEKLADAILAADAEPEYPVGTVVRDVMGSYYRRRHGGTWETFGTTSNGAPVRPLTVI